MNMTMDPKSIGVEDDWLEQTGLYHITRLAF